MEWRDLERKRWRAKKNRVVKNLRASCVKFDLYKNPPPPDKNFTYTDSDIDSYVHLVQVCVGYVLFFALLSLAWTILLSD